MQRFLQRLMPALGMATITATITATLGAAETSVVLVRLDVGSSPGAEGGAATAVIRVQTEAGEPASLPETVEFELTSGLPERVSVPRTITLAAGASSVSFLVTAQAAEPADGTATVAISGSSEATGTLRSTIHLVGVAGIPGNG